MAQNVSVNSITKLRSQIRKRRDEQDRFSQKIAESKKSEEKLCRQLKESEFQYLTQLVSMTGFPINHQDYLIGFILECKEYMETVEDTQKDERCKEWQQRYLHFCEAKKIKALLSGPLEEAETAGKEDLSEPEQPALFEGGEAG